MIARNWMELGLLVVLIAGGIISKLLLRGKLRDIDGLGPITRPSDGIKPQVVIETEQIQVTKEEKPGEDV